MWTSNDSTYGGGGGSISARSSSVPGGMTSSSMGTADGLLHPGAGGWSSAAWSPPVKGRSRSHLWSALLLLAVGVVTLAVLAVVALAIVIGGYEGVGSRSGSSKVNSLAPSATWGEEPAEQHPPGGHLRPSPPPPIPPTAPPPLHPNHRSQLQTRRPVSSSSTSTLRPSTAAPTTSAPTRPTPTPSPRPIPQAGGSQGDWVPVVDNNERKLTPPAELQISGGVSFERPSPSTSKRPELVKYQTEEAWEDEEELELPAVRGEAVVLSTLQEVEAEGALSRLPSRSYSGVNSMRPMPNLFPSANKDKSTEPPVPLPQPTTSPTPPVTAKHAEVESPFFIASLTHGPSDEKRSFTSELPLHISPDQTTSIPDLNHRLGMIDAISKSFVNVAIRVRNPNRVTEPPRVPTSSSSQPPPTTLSSSKPPQVTTLPSSPAPSSPETPEDTPDGYSPVNLLPAMENTTTTEKSKTFSTEPTAVSTEAVEKETRYSAKISSSVAPADDITGQEVSVVTSISVDVENTALPEDRMDEEVTESAAASSHVTTRLEPPSPTPPSTPEHLSHVEPIPDPSSPLSSSPSPTPSSTPSSEHVSHIEPILESSSSPSPPPSPPTEAIPAAPSVVSLLSPPRPAVTGSQHRAAKVDPPGQGQQITREPKTGPTPSKETLLQAFPKSEFNSAPSFLLQQRRNNTAKKTTPAPTVAPVVKNCTCSARLLAQGLGRKLCDGVVDCWDFSDEDNCEWCEPGQYVCAQSRACVPRSRLCDGRRDCPFGDDERACVAIAPDRRRAESTHYHEDGLLMVQQAGQWGPLCVEKLEGTSWRLADVARAVCRALTYSDFELAEQVVEAERQGPYFELNLQRGEGGRNNSRTAVVTPRLAVSSSACPSRSAVRLGCRELQCGVRPLAVSQWARIVGGGNAGPGAWPWQAALYREGQFQCGGSLIAAQWVLSASHCFAHNLEAYWVARLGALRRGTDLASPFEQLRRVARITQHPAYLDSGFVNDLALLKLEKPVDFSDYVRPVCLPSPPPLTPPVVERTAPPEQQAEAEGEPQMCTVVGWGQLSEVGRIFPDTLQEVQLPLISTEECRKRTLFLPLYRVTDDMFCAGYDRGGRDACLGDSGGPLMCQRPDGRWELTGITSNGYGCARAHRPGVYTKVANYVTWINAVLEGRTTSSNVTQETSGSSTTTSSSKPRCPSGQRRCALGQCMAVTRDRCGAEYCPPAV